MNHNIDLLSLIETYQNQLEFVRQNPDLLNNYRFDKDANCSNHFERLRLNIAIYNDLRPSDYEIAKFLFIEEMKWRTDIDDSENGEVDNLYFSAFILTFFNNPEIIWLFFDTKNIDFDSGSGFDGEYLIFAGIKKTYEYLERVDNIHKTELLAYIGEAIDNCHYSEKEINDWREYKARYFRGYKYPVEDELDFLFSTNERELFLKKLPAWIKQDRSWTYEELSLFRTYARYSGSKYLEIEAFKLTLEKNDKDFLTDIYNRQLAELYIDVGEQNDAIEIIRSVIDGTDNENVIRDCIEQLCRVIIINKEKWSNTSKVAFEMIQQQQKIYGHFSPYVDELINEAKQIM